MPDYSDGGGVSIRFDCIETCQKLYSVNSGEGHLQTAVAVVVGPGQNTTENSCFPVSVGKHVKTKREH